MSPNRAGLASRVLAASRVVSRSRSRPGRTSRYTRLSQGSGCARTRAAADPDRAQGGVSAPVPVRSVTPRSILGCGANRSIGGLFAGVCSVDQPEAVLPQIFSILLRGGELRFWSTSPALALWTAATLADATVWPRLSALSYHPTPSARSPMPAFGPRPKHDLEFAAWVPMPVSEVVIAVRPNRPSCALAEQCGQLCSSQAGHPRRSRAATRAASESGVRSVNLDDGGTAGQRQLGQPAAG